jgi:hypothetical protein
VIRKLERAHDIIADIRKALADSLPSLPMLGAGKDAEAGAPPLSDAQVIEHSERVADDLRRTPHHPLTSSHHDLQSILA